MFRHPFRVEHLQQAALEAGLGEIRRSPKDAGRVELIVRRPSENEREVLREAELDPVEGLAGDKWSEDAAYFGPDRSAVRKSQLTLMNARVAALVAARPERRQLAGDQLYVDLDLSCENLPPGTRLRVGSAVIEVTDLPHRGCKKFAARFGQDALRFVNSPQGRELNLRGINARVLAGGTVSTGGVIRKLPAESTSATK
jgi:MOSC domain-containing protein YiiM